MVRRAVNRTNSGIHQIFYKPDDVRDFEYLDEDLIQTDEIVGDEFGVVIVDPETDPEGELPVLEFITIVEQTLHKNYSGYDVVDLVVKVDDFAQVKSWNVRVVEVGDAV